MSKNLSGYFKNNEDANDDMGPSVSMAIEADDQEQFQKSTFNLKRTRSIGLFSDYLDTNTPLHTTSKTIAKPEVTRDDSMDSDLEYDNGSSESYDSYDEDMSSEDEDDDLQAGEQLQLHRTQDHAGTADWSATPSKTPGQSASVSPPPADNDTILIPQDDNDLVMEPNTHVDYLSHNWNESEVLNSWKYIILKKKRKDDVIDSVSSARLENASWRTWAKARNHLETVSPEIVNWSKDSDVTWLYGPVVTDSKSNEEYDEYSKDAASLHNLTAEMGYGSDDETSKRLATKMTKKQLKPILKKRSVTEIIEENTQWKLNEVRKHLNEMKNSIVLLDSYNSSEAFNDYNYLANKLNAQYYSNNNKKVENNPNNNPNNNNNNNPDQNHSVLNSTASSSSHSTLSVKENEDKSISVNKNDNNDYNYDNKIHDSGNNSYSTLKNNTGQLTDKGPKNFKSNSTSTLTTFMINTNDSFDHNTLDYNTNTTTTTMDTNDLKKKNLLMPALASILTTSVSKQNKPQAVRHIHFSDRVEQCISLGYSQRDVMSMYSSNDTSSDEDESGRLQDYNHRDYLSQENNDMYNSDNSSNSEYLQSNSSGNEDDNEDGGLFINARFSRRLSTSVNSTVTDNSSLISSSTSRNRLKPIIKLLPATTLNYGSDEESDNSDYDYNYGNAVSHNVNTYRGYDYMYDYNSVYTGDTSNFLPIDHSEVVDIPEGIDLQTSIADDSSNYNQGMISPTIEAHPILNLGFNGSAELSSSNRGGFMCGPSDSEFSNSDNEQQFIENSQNQSSEDDTYTDYHANDTGIKRYASVGKGGSSTSLKDLSRNGSNVSLSGATHSFITGKVLTPHLEQSNISEKPIKLVQSAPPFHRQASKNNFIFDSDSSDNEADVEDIQMVDVPSVEGNSTNWNDVQPSSAIPIPSTLKANFGIDSKSPSPAQVEPSTVAINGSFSLRNNSIKSVISETDL
ncbi:hypothetical protein TPHA_0M00980 [Tetrapisispora phaffii CBS 4417]|uniref:Nitrogen regulatory protein areA GATA-like domain-containing protein n=1 Tax=Tetrapisispora phaffii (strain ATCC 24235 / CBS 4417 / NBRC 1672 / NRRL Y-8282 / UCD 70-5) TaxID=1071381 RepID=G8C0F7_TETPH|nr:hypothetical protein TPHA_0M00980 [Tetrapisispora phaffii CBS 4417]CCE65672.1 hypothetical protein TPHA_0M00980 [Tetrapisispora phaffii CBS 4417]